MLMSYLLSRTLVPTMVRYLLAKEARGAPRSEEPAQLRRRASTAGSIGFAHALRPVARVVRSRTALFVVVAFAVFVVASLALLPLLGRDFFPTVDAGLIKLHVRGSPGTRIEETEKRMADDRAHDPRP